MTIIQESIKKFFETSQYHMANISNKSASFRRAIAMGKISVKKAAFKHIEQDTLPKGDVLTLAEIAGINGAKTASQNIPLCHPLSLDHVAIHTELDKDSSSINVYCVVATYAKTGVEMEALAGVNAALLTIYDLTKPIEPALLISDIRLLIKEGGKKGLWMHPDGIPNQLIPFLPNESLSPLENVNTAVITLSDRASEGKYDDKSGVLLRESLEQLGANLTNYTVLPDDISALEQQLTLLVKEKTQLIITTGGTGLSPRDITPETIAKLCNKQIPGISELLRQHGANNTQHSWLSRSFAGIIDNTLVISLPGSLNAIKDSIEALKVVLPHAIDQMQNEKPTHQHDNCCCI